MAFVLCVRMLMVMMSLFISACSRTSSFKQKLYADYSVGTLHYKDTDNAYEKLISELIKHDNKGVIDSFCIYSTTFQPDQEEICALERGIVIGDLIGISDEMCEMHMKTIFGNDAAFNIFTGTVTNAFSGAATVVGGEVAKSALSAMAFFSNAERSLVNETVYKSMLVSAVAMKIRESRDTQRDRLAGKIINNTASPYHSYPINVALLDVIAYHQSCSFMYGLQKALQEGIQNTRERDIGVLENRLEQISLEIDNRRRQLPPDQINKDSVLKQLNDRYDAVANELKKLETSVK